MLLITYYWPPVSSPGVQRWLKFVKYLKDYKIQTTVMIAENASAPSVDPSLLLDVPVDIEVIKTKSIEPILLYNLLQGKNTRAVEVGLGEIKEPKSLFKKLARYLRSNVFIPDAKIGWYYNIRNRALRQVRSKDIEVLITTGPPHTTHLIGRYIKEHQPNINWIVDLRDPWTGLYYEKVLSRTQKSQAKNTAMEQSVLDNADIILTVSNGMKIGFPNHQDKITVIPNGYDQEDFFEFTPRPTPHFTLTYTGNLKTNQDITAFWQALAEMKANPTFMTDFRLLLVGNISPTILERIKAYKLEALIVHKDFVPHKASITIMQEASLLWLPIPVANNNQYILTGKIYEYLASRTPILSIGPVDGDAARILDQCGRNVMVDYNDVASIKQQLTSHIDQWRINHNTGKKHSGNEHMRYARRTLTGRLAKMIWN